MILGQFVEFQRQDVKRVYGPSNIRTDYMLNYLDSQPATKIFEFIDMDCVAPVVELKDDKLRGKK